MKSEEAFDDNVTPACKEKDRCKIKSEIDDFLSNGGKIHVVKDMVKKDRKGFQKNNLKQSFWTKKDSGELDNE